jgi:hypothetical protein
LARYDVQLRCRCTAEASLLLSLWEKQLLVEDNAKAVEKKGIRGAIRFAPELWTTALAIRRQQLQELLTRCSALAQRLKRMQHGAQHEALAPNLISFGVARCVACDAVCSTRASTTCEGGCLRRGAAVW